MLTQPDGEGPGPAVGAAVDGPAVAAHVSGQDDVLRAVGPVRREPVGVARQQVCQARNLWAGLPTAAGLADHVGGAVGGAEIQGGVFAHHGHLERVVMARDHMGVVAVVQICHAAAHPLHDRNRELLPHTGG